MNHALTEDSAKRWTRLATGLAAAGVLMLGAGGVVLAVGGASQADPGQEKVGVCHRTASESNPYVYISVPRDEANGHITGTDKSHNSKVTWDTDGTWRGVPHEAGDLRLDYFAFDDEIAAGKCFDVTPTVEPTETTSPTVEPTETTSPTVEPTETTSPTVEPTETTSPTVEPTETTSPTVEPTETTSPTVAPTETTSPTVAPTETSSPTVAPTETTSPTVAPTDAARPDQQTLPRTIDSGVGGLTAAAAWAAGLFGGGAGLLFSSGGIFLGARRAKE